MSDILDSIDELDDIEDGDLDAEDTHPISIITGVNNDDDDNYFNEDDDGSGGVWGVLIGADDVGREMYIEGCIPGEDEYSHGPTHHWIIPDCRDMCSTGTTVGGDILVSLITALPGRRKAHK